MRRRVSRSGLPGTALVVLAFGVAASAQEVREPAKRPLNIAHRGASAHAPEHTFAAFDLALEMKADYIEQDVQLTSDGVLVVLHDETLDRTARGPGESCRGEIQEKALAQLASCDVGRWFVAEHPERAQLGYAEQRIPTLREVFERYGRRARYYIETKHPDEAPGMEAALLALLEEFGLTAPARSHRQVLIQSFHPGSLRSIHARDPKLPLVQLLAKRETSKSIRARLPEIAAYAVGIGPQFGSVDRPLVEAAHGIGLEIHPYTVNDPEEMRRLLGLGVDGIFTDSPDRLEAIEAGR